MPKLQIRRIHHISLIYGLYLRDLFHTLVNLKTRSLLFLFCVTYMFAFTILAVGFYVVDQACDLGLDSFHEAFALAVETWLTIGYGVNGPSGAYFKECRSAVVLVTVQGIVGLFVNAILVSLVISHMSSGLFRGTTLIFSEKAAIREINGHLYLMMQVCEARSTQLLETHVRAYVIRRPVSAKEAPVDSPQAFEMRLLLPDDARGALMLPVLPSVIVHEIDRCSPLAPLGSCDDALVTRHWARPPVREVDARIGERDMVWCRTCGESFQCEEMLDAHQRYQAEQDMLNGTKLRPHTMPLAPAASEKQLSQSSFGMLPPPIKAWRRSVQEFLASEWFEILVLLEGVDTITSATVQARHSYTAEDLVWDCTFAPMLHLSSGSATIDFTKMDDLVLAPPEK